ncbi:DUF5681 domain-containing protein [Qipengyuania atrilutea]|uniref:DUF5681 domain-containing protein n=1 Tax=Qipengyuania atrilutea TaxID=2744473 RepID=A0A850H580_9SPHN|nr:DUF5681 domain-containing protein [Actirhodobacter atriluteus]NVD45013.1 hypothetical protein [Actirhodobacter atriluteus]
MNDDEGYEVGYGKPPKATRFQSGQSGNPRGRPKGSAGIQTLLAKHLGKMVNVTIDGHQQRKTIKEAAVLSLVKSLINGTPDQKIKLLKFIMPLLEERETDEEFDFGKLSDDEVDMLEALLVKGGRTS